MTSDVLLTTFWYALTLALHTHTAQARDAGRDGTTTVGATGDGPYHIFGSNSNVTVHRFGVKVRFPRTRGWVNTYEPR